MGYHVQSLRLKDFCLGVGGFCTGRLVPEIKKKKRKRARTWSPSSLLRKKRNSSHSPWSIRIQFPIHVCCMCIFDPCNSLARSPLPLPSPIQKSSIRYVKFYFYFPFKSKINTHEFIENWFSSLKGLIKMFFLNAGWKLNEFWKQF